MPLNFREPKNGTSWSIGAVLLVASILFVYRNTYTVPLLLDDLVTVGDNPSIRRLSEIGAVLEPPSHVYSSGRPILNLSFALNYAFGGTNPAGYHGVNIWIHIAAALALFGLLNRILRLPVFHDKFEGDATLVAFAATWIWALHPLQTASITYISQRAESLMGLCYILGLYCFIRGAVEQKAQWTIASIAAVFCGVATKEVMVTAPVVVLLCDRMLIGGSFRAVWRARGRWHVILFSSWLLLAYLMISSHIADRDVGAAAHVTVWNYLVTESQVVVAYFKLCLWPSDLVFYYGPELYAWSENTLRSLLSAVAIAGTGTWFLLLLRQKNTAGLPGLCFLLLLAPTSSLVPLSQQPMAESRLYLPSATLWVGIVFILYHYFGRRSFPWLALIAIGFGGLTFARNYDYRSEIAIWADTALKQPRSARAHWLYGLALSAIPHRLDEAIGEYEASIRIDPNFADAHHNLGVLLAQTAGREAAAVQHYRLALRAKPNSPATLNNLGLLLATSPLRLEEAQHCFEAALRLDPGHFLAHYNLANLLAAQPGREPEAIAHYRAALSSNPNHAGVHNNFGNLLATIPGRQKEAFAEYEAALLAEPGSYDAHNNAGLLWASMPEGEAAAIRHYEAALRLKPEFAAAHFNLGNLLARMPNRRKEAMGHYEEALKAKPDFGAAAHNLGVLQRRKD